MRNTYHFCLASHDEVLFRDEEDFNIAFNCFAFAILDTESRALSDAELSTHLHYCAQTDHPEILERKRRYAYGRYFNAKYHRCGRVGERNCFIIKVDGIRHQIAANSYVFRQGLHHGLTSTPFEYEYCSANVIFADELGHRREPELLRRSAGYKFLPDERHIPEGYRMSSSGLILRQDVIDTAYVEELFVTPRNFIFNMNRISDEKWIREQQEDDFGGTPITLATIEKGVDKRSISEMLANEHGHIDKSAMNDMELCRWIDDVYVPSFFNGDMSRTLYDIPKTKREGLAEKVYDWLVKHKGTVHMGIEIKRITPKQFRRCFGI